MGLNIPLFTAQSLPSAMILSLVATEQYRTIKELSFGFMSAKTLPTIENFESLQKLYVNFNGDQEGEMSMEPVARLDSLPRLKEITLSSGWNRHGGCGPINCHFVGTSKSLTKFTLESDGVGKYPPSRLYKCNTAISLQELLSHFPNIRHLALIHIADQNLHGVKLPKLETLEAHWCTLGTTRGMCLPSLVNISVAIPMVCSEDPLWEIDSFLPSVQRAVIRLEWDVYKNGAIDPSGELIQAVRIYADEGDSGRERLCDITEIYRLLAPCDKNPTRTVLIEGEATSPEVRNKGLRYLSYGSDKEEDRKAASMKRQQVFHEMDFGRIFRNSEDQEWRLITPEALDADRYIDRLAS